MSSKFHETTVWLYCNSLICYYVMYQGNTCEWLSIYFSSVVISHEAMLIRYLLHRLYHFGMLARPLLNSSHAVSVQFGMALVQILDFDETRQLIVTHVWKSYVSTRVLALNCFDMFIVDHLTIPLHHRTFGRLRSRVPKCNQFSETITGSNVSDTRDSCSVYSDYMHVHVYVITSWSQTSCRYIY